MGSLELKTEAGRPKYDTPAGLRRLGMELLEDRRMLSNWSGYITGDVVWDDTSEPYVIDGHLTVNPNASLTVAPGVEVETKGYGYSGAGYELTVHGTLNAQGATFANRTELYARPGSHVDLNGCDISSNWTLTLYKSEDEICSSVVFRSAKRFSTGNAESSHFVRSGRDRLKAVFSLKCRTDGLFRPIFMQWRGGSRTRTAAPDRWPGACCAPII